MRPRLALLLVLAACDHAPTSGAQTVATSASSSPTTIPSTTPSSTSTSTSTPDAAPLAATPDAAPTPQEPAPEGMVRVPAGDFTMGADTGGEEDEHPAHTVTLKAFWLDKTEVTNEAYAACVATKTCRPKAANEPAFSYPTQPVSFVGWEDAKTFCEWKGKRLPMEAEFEKAVRDSDGRKYPWGNDPPTAELAVFGQPTTLPVGSRGKKGAGPYGNDDLAGNVWEWQADFYDPYAYRRPTASEGKPGTCEEIMTTLNELHRDGKQGFTGSNPIPDECEHSIRGGAFNYAAPGLRASNRVHHPGRFRIRVLGFRCAKDATP